MFSIILDSEGFFLYDFILGLLYAFKLWLLLFSNKWFLGEKKSIFIKMWTPNSCLKGLIDVCLLKQTLPVEDTDWKSPCGDQSHNKTHHNRKPALWNTQNRNIHDEHFSSFKKLDHKLKRPYTFITSTCLLKAGQKALHC